MEQTPSPVDTLWRDRVAPACGLPQPLSLFPIPEGYSTEVYEVDLGEVRKILRVYPDRAKSRLEGYLLAHRTLSGLGIRVPSLDRWEFGRDRHWLLEEKIEGTGLKHLLSDPSAVAIAARTLAALHSNTRHRYGEVNGWGGFRLTLRWRQRLPERWAKLTRLIPELEEVGAKVEAWFRDWSETYSPRTYNLLHNDFHPGNVILTPDGEAALLDLRSPRYGLGLMELIEAAHHFTGEERTHWAPFTEPYFAHQSGVPKEDFEKFGDSCHAVFHLRQADRYANLALGTRGTIHDRRNWERNAADSWARFCRISGVVGPVLHLPESSAFSKPVAPLGAVSVSHGKRENV